MDKFSFLIWLHHKITGNSSILRSYEELGKSQWMASDNICKYQLEKFREIVAYAQEHVEYYRQIFKSIGLDNAMEIKSVADIQKIPVLTKADIRNNLERMTAARNDLVMNQTGGSTGTPLKFFCDRDFFQYAKLAANYRAYNVAGYKLGDNMGIIWGYDNDLPKHSRLVGSLRQKVYNYYELNSFNLTTESIEKYIQQAVNSRISYFKGYVSSLTEIAKYVLNNNIDFKYPVKAVFAEAERLDGVNRELIEKAFRAKVYNIYGAREFGTICYECSAHNGLHVNFEQLFMEITENSKILITSFLNRGTPFIRYEIGDCADEIVLDKCECGRSSYRVNKILGRESDNFITAAGKIIHGEFITHLFYNAAHVQQFQMIQESFTDITINLVAADANMAGDEMNCIREMIQAHFEDDLNIKVNFVDEIVKTRTGKFKFTICNLPKESGYEFEK